MEYESLQKVPQIKSILELVIFMDNFAILLKAHIVELIIEVDQGVKSGLI